MGHTWKNRTHCEIFNTFQNVAIFYSVTHFSHCDEMSHLEKRVTL